MMEVLLTIAASTLRVSTPLLFAALGGIASERAGVVNIALEGLMLIGAFAGAAIAYYTHSPALGAVGAMGAGVLLAAFYGLFVVKLKADQIVAGTAINLLAAGLAPFLCKILFESGTNTPTLPMEDRFQSGPIWLAWILVLFFYLWMRYTASGLWLQFAGEHPEALATAGVRVSRVRWMAVLASGALAGLGGATLSIFLSSSFSRNMTAGRGFMALAAMIFGKWKPLPTAAACLFFGLADALQIRLQGVVLWGTEPVPVQFIQIMPYIVTVFVLAGFVGKSRPPRALGTPLSILVLLFSSLTLTGCNLTGFSEFKENLKKEADAVVVVLQGGRSPLGKNGFTPRPEASATPSAAELSRQNAELLREMYHVIFLAEPENKVVFGSFVDTVNQGASLEGIYNGWTHSSQYRQLEQTGAKQDAVAAAALLQLFSEELAEIEYQLPVRRQFDIKDALPLAEIMMPPEYSESEAIAQPLAPMASAAPAVKVPVQVLIEEYKRLFKDASFFTLKRILADEALQLVAAKAEEPQQLADWYSKWVLRTNLAGVNFGLALRNNSNSKFHQDWALKNSRDRLSWEVLNRVHRLLNSRLANAVPGEKK